MNRPDPIPPSPSPGSEARTTVQEPPAQDPDRALWVQFLQADSVEAFYRSWLVLLCRMVGGVSGAVLLLGPPDSGPYAPAATWPGGRERVTHLIPMAERALKERRGIAERAEGGSGAGTAAPARERFDIAYPIEVDGRLHGVVVLDVAARPGPRLQAAVRQVHWGSAWLEVLFRRQEAAQGGVPAERLRAVLDLVAAAAGPERFFEAATAFVTALATRLGCDRASVGFVRGGRARVRAVSHTAQFEEQTNLLRAIGEAMDEAVDQQATLVYPPAPGRDDRVVGAHERLAQQHGAGAICTVPLSDGGRVVGALTCERPAERPFDGAAVELLEGVAALSGPVLERHRREDRWLAAKAAEACRTQLAHLVGPHHVALKLVAVALVGLTIFLAVARGESRVTGKTVMEPTIRRAAVAPFNGYIAAARVRAGDVVRQGDTLFVLDDRELKLERLKWASQLEQSIKEHQQALAKRDAAQMEILSAQVAQARAQLALVTDQLARAQGTAPFDGVVVEGDLSQSLGAPVERGKVLFELAPLDAYRVVLQVDERDMLPVAVGQRGNLVLSAFPTETLPFTVEKLTPVSTAREGRNYFRVELRLERTPPGLRPGMEGVGKIEVGPRRLLWIWTHQVTDWIRLTLWTWLP